MNARLTSSPGTLFRPPGSRAILILATERNLQKFRSLWQAQYWKPTGGFFSLHPIWIDRFGKRVNGELMRALSDDSRDAYEQYLAAYKLMHKRDKEIASALDDFRRSTVQRQFFKLQSFENSG